MGGRERSYLLGQGIETEDQELRVGEDHYFSSLFGSLSSPAKSCIGISEREILVR